MDLLYSNEPVVTQLDDGEPDGPGTATSANSMPSMVALGDHAPYDRILSTCALREVPPSLVAQLAPGGCPDRVAGERGRLGGRGRWRDGDGARAEGPVG
ncbi:hypothetical protein [Streptomyces sp. NPDC053560]|uniref:hypothetical protein n=1 Tax=Streptomyces sp. NPDC053560 TaxID=3365711 RepID=UPI0037D09B20